MLYFVHCVRGVNVIYCLSKITQQTHDLELFAVHADGDKKGPSKSPGLYMYVRYANIITMVHLTALDSRPGGGGGGVLTYMFRIGRPMCRGKDPPFLPDPHLRPPFFRVGPAPKTPLVRAVPAPKASLFQPARTPSHQLIMLTSKSKDNK